jgi:hypothetical protein
MPPIAELSQHVEVRFDMTAHDKERRRDRLLKEKTPQLQRVGSGTVAGGHTGAIVIRQADGTAWQLVALDVSMKKHARVPIGEGMGDRGFSSKRNRCSTSGGIT